MKFHLLKIIINLKFKLCPFRCDQGFDHLTIKSYD